MGRVHLRTKKTSQTVLEINMSGFWKKKKTLGERLHDGFTGKGWDSERKTTLGEKVQHTTQKVSDNKDAIVKGAFILGGIAVSADKVLGTQADIAEEEDNNFCKNVHSHDYNLDSEEDSSSWDMDSDDSDESDR